MVAVARWHSSRIHRYVTSDSLRKDRTGARVPSGQNSYISTIREAHRGSYLFPVSFYHIDSLYKRISKVAIIKRRFHGTVLVKDTPHLWTYVRNEQNLCQQRDLAISGPISSLFSDLLALVESPQE